MGQLPFFNYLPVMFKIATSLDVRTKRCNEYVFFFRSLLQAFFIFSTTSCTFGKVEAQDVTIVKLHDLFLLIILFSTDIIIFINKSKAYALFELVTKPLQCLKENTTHSKIVEDHNKEVNLYCKVVTIFYSVVSLLWHIYSLGRVIWQFNLNNTDNECVRMATGWVWNSDYQLYLIFLNSYCLQMSIFSFTSWYVFMFCIVARIKYMTRLLCASLDEIDDSMSWSEEYLISNSSSVLELAKPGTNINIICNDATRNHRTISVQIQTSLRERRKINKIAIYFKRMVNQHLDIIE